MKHPAKSGSDLKQILGIISWEDILNCVDVDVDPGIIVLLSTPSLSGYNNFKSI